MIQLNTEAPGFKLRDHLGRSISLEQFRGKKHVMLLFYPLDFTPTWTVEVPALEASLDRFTAANTQPLGVSVDSVFSHANWAASMGGISYPLLSDFHPKGAMGDRFGVYVAEAGLTARSTVIIDAGGVVRYTNMVEPGGQRDMAELAAECEKVDAAYEGALPAASAPEGMPDGGILYLRSNCGASRAVLLAADNLHLRDKLTVKNVSEDATAMAALEQATGGKQAPALVCGEDAMLESKDIIKYLVSRSTSL